MDIKILIQAIDNLLKPDTFKDYSPNGLQISGVNSIQHIVTGVSASLELLEKAVDIGADMILVHHGYFWQGEDKCIVGMKQKRIKMILDNNINLVAYHLPLDIHHELGNNAQLAKLLDFMIHGVLNNKYVFYGELKKPMYPVDLQNKITNILNRKPLLIQANNQLIRSIAWCSGAAQKYINDAALFGVDAYLSGEISEPTTYIAKEMNINYFACGHHATERYGIQALGNYLAKNFDIKHSYIDINNPV